LKAAALPVKPGLTRACPSARCGHRWTIEALATKFRVRRQRVLAILALKEIEAQAMEDGRLMKGPFK
jgi:hypothetical protein